MKPERGRRVQGGGHRLPAGRPPNENTQGRVQALEGAAGRRRAPLKVGVPQGHKEKCARPEPRAGTLLTPATVHLPRLLLKPREGRGEERRGRSRNQALAELQTSKGSRL